MAGRFGQPVDDINASTTSESTSSPPVLASPQDDITSTSSVSGKNRTQEERMVINGVGRPAPNHAGAFMGEQNYYDHLPRGPFREPVRLSLDRALSELHLSKVASAASKELNKDLQDAAGFTDFECGQVRSIDRKGACAEILNIWHLKGGETKAVYDLKVLLERAGGQQEKYKQLITDIVKSPP